MTTTGRHRRQASGAAALLGLVLPLACGGCGAEGVRWCARCAAEVGTAPAPHSPSPRPAGLPPLWTLTAYDGAVRTAVVAMKDRGRHDLARPLGRALARPLAHALRAVAHGEDVLVVPAPSAAWAVARRGGDVVAELADAAVARLVEVGSLDPDGLRVQRALRQRGRVLDQAGLDAGARTANLGGRLAARRRAVPVIAGRRCVLVDDVVTTGATLAEAARAVRAAGGLPVGAVTLAATRRRTASTAPETPGMGGSPPAFRGTLGGPSRLRVSGTARLV